MNFVDFNLSEPILDGLRDVGFSAPTKIQRESIVPILDGSDIIASSETGTGKTGAFVIPVLQKLTVNQTDGVRCLILTPTRELANQIDEQVTVIGYYSGVTSATVFGGTDGNEFGIQERALRENGANIIIATPGRLLDHIKMGYADFSKLEVLILDEADRMLDMGFLPDVKKILAKLPEQRQNILFSATIPDTLHKFFQSIVNNPVRIDCSVAKTASGIEQFMYRVTEETREEVITSLLKNDEVTSAIVFTKTKRDADYLFKKLVKADIAAGVIHGDREQGEREITLDGFKSGKIRVLVATDVLARGIDVDEVSHVFNFQVPNEPEDYIHRIGRTARAEAKGTAVTLVSGKEMRAWGRIKAHVKTPIEERYPEGAEVPAQTEENDSESTGKAKRGRGRAKAVKNEQASSISLKEMMAQVPASTANEEASKQYIRTSTTKRQPKSETAEEENVAVSVAQTETQTAKAKPVIKKPKEAVVETAPKVDDEPQTDTRKSGKRRPAKKQDRSENQPSSARPAQPEKPQTRVKSDSDKGRRSKSRRDRESSSDKRKPSLTKREEMQRRFEAVDNKPSFFSKIKKLFGFGN
ncbi:DEAD/DEAH box helicase [bacterium]|nr:MAG: DEAD/DEAH box helicase [bacterium]